MLIIWTDNLSVGMKAFDDDHKRLIQIINELHYLVQEGKAEGQIPLEEIEIQLHRLENYTRYHCACEEKLLAMTCYPKLAEHKLEHENLIAKIADMSERFKGSTCPSDAEELMNFAYEWVRDHISSTDKEYAEHLRSFDLSPDDFRSKLAAGR
jgi:hemerythrin